MKTQDTGLSTAETPLETRRGAVETPKLIVTDRIGIEKTIDAEDGLFVMEIIRNSGADEPFALCGGSCSCATCHVYVDAAFVGALPQMSPEESDVLDGSGYRRETSRLSCQIVFQNKLSGLRVKIAPAD
jgi:2Fe-2S ferredoxin